VEEVEPEPLIAGEDLLLDTAGFTGVLAWSPIEIASRTPPEF
jgi:hypothetical protein